MKTKEEILARVDDLEQDMDDYPSAREALLWALEPSPVVHESKEKERCEHAHPGWLNKEKVFADKWLATNNPPSFVNGGVGTLTWLLCSRASKTPSFFNGYEIDHHLTQEEATAAASAIQWLGTSCGWCWLEECIRDCGFDVVQRREPKA